MPATISDVAREARVARSTVSAVLTGRRFVEPHTRARVEAAIASLNFSVNSRARALATARTMTIGLVVRFHGPDFSPALLTYLVGVSDAARDRGFSVLLVTDSDGSDAIVRLAREGQVDGFVLLNVFERDPRLEAIRLSGLPTVLIGMPDDIGVADAVDLDFRAAGELLVRHMYDCGERMITLLTLPEEVLAAGATFAVRFREGVVDRARKFGVQVHVVATPASPATVRLALRSLLATETSNTAMIVHNDAAVAALPAVLSGLGIGSQVRIASAHSAELTDLYAIPYARVETRPDEVAARAIDALLNRMSRGGNARSNDGRPTRILLSPAMVGRPA